MTLHVTHHALTRFCERCLGMETPAERPKRQVLRRLLNKACDARPGYGVLMVWDHWPAVIEGDRIVTVLEPWQRPMKPGRASARRDRRAA